MASIQQATRMQPKRKRAEISYCEIDSENSEADGYGSSLSEPSSKKKPKANNTKVTAAGPLPKKKIFPFTSLPAELKNQIYEFALTDEHSINLSSVTKHYRRIIERVVTLPSNDYYSHGRRRSWHAARSHSPIVNSANSKLSSLIPKLFLLNKAIYTESQPFLYSNNTFRVEDTTTLHAFLANIGPRNCASLQDITVCGWGYTKAHKALNHPAFTMLTNAVNLRRLDLDCRIAWSGGPKTTARQLYRDGFHWLEAVGTAKGQFDAAVELIDLKAENFEYSWRSRGGSQDQPTAEERVEEFRNELRRLLRSDQKAQRKR